MNRYIKTFVTLFLVFIVSGLLAQESNYKIGVHPGINVCYFDIDTQDVRPGFLPAIGISYQHPLKKFGRLQLEARYNLRGVNSSEQYLKYRYHYLGFRINDYIKVSKNTQFALGVHPSFLVSSGIYTASHVYPLSTQGLKTQLNIGAAFCFNLKENHILELGAEYPVNQSKIIPITISYSILIKPGERKHIRELKEAEARKEIISLSKSSIMVKLPTSSNKIKWLLENGDTVGAKSIKEEQYASNLKVVQAFRKTFNFCPVYFFYSDQVDKIKTGKWEGVFLDDELKPLKSVMPILTSYYILDLGYFSNSYKVDDENSYINISDKEYYGFLLKTAQFKRLEPPLPYFQKVFRTGNEIDWLKTISSLNYRLNQYAQSNK